MAKTKKVYIKKYLYPCLAGLAAGAANGLFGGGGGMVVVPMLSYLMKYNQKNSQATAILIILPLSVLSGILYAAFGSFDLGVGLPVGGGVIIGGIIGSFILPKISSKILKIIFSVLMLVAGVRLAIL